MHAKVDRKQVEIMKILLEYREFYIVAYWR